jgi:hypothetical protein
LVSSTAQNAGASRISTLPNPSESGSRRMATPIPKRRRTGPATNNCSTKLRAPSAKLNVPKNRVKASAFPPK